MNILISLGDQSTIYEERICPRKRVLFIFLILNEMNSSLIVVIKKLGQVKVIVYNNIVLYFP